MIFTQSLKSNRDFKKVYASRKSKVSKYLIMYITYNNTENNRLGISVSKKVGNSVVRHYVKRCIKEAYRLHENMFNSGLDIVVIARQDAKTAKYEDFEKDLLHLMNKHKVLI